MCGFYWAILYINSMKQEFQYWIKLQLFDSRILTHNIQLIIMLQLQH